MSTNQKPLPAIHEETARLRHEARFARLALQTVPVVICAWCPVDPTKASYRGASHGICPACIATFDREAA